MRQRLSRRGSLLPTVLAVMVIIALAATAALHITRKDRRASANTRAQTTALAAVDAALAAGLGQAHSLAPMLDPGISILRRLPSIDPGVESTVHLTRLGETLFALTADARVVAARGESARRRTSMVLRLEPASIPFPAAMSVSGTSLPDADVADGADRAPQSWQCPDSLRDVPALRHPSPAADSFALEGLRSRAAIRLPAGSAVHRPGPLVTAGECDAARPDNWGDASGAGPCGSWLPIIHAAGDLRVDGGAGQGILLVDGDLSVSGGFEFRGAVIVGGAIDVGLGGAMIVGGAIAEGITGAWSAGASRPVVVRSSCALDAALLAGGSIVPVMDRPWVAVR